MPSRLPAWHEPPTTGFIIVNPTEFTATQKRELEKRVKAHAGWPHPDGIRWLLPVNSPNTTREKWVRAGWPSDSVEIAH